jgi:FkbM family methyltransferase
VNTGLNHYAIRSAVPFGEAARSGKLTRIAISELINNGIVEWFGDGWKQIHHKAVGHPVLMAGDRGVIARIQVPSRATGLWVLRHNWSGIVKVQLGDNVQRVELRSQIDDFDFVIPLSCPPGGPSEVVVTVDCDEGTPSSQAQVWVLGLTFDGVPPVRGKSKTLSSTTRLIEGNWGHFLVLNNDQVIPTEILNQGAWGLADIELFKKHISIGDCVLDIGTHVGHHTIVFSKLVGQNGLVLSVEAQRVMYQLMNANCIINGAFNVRPIHAAASDHHHIVSLYPTDYGRLDNFGSLGVNPTPERFPSEKQGESVVAVCVDDLVEQHCEGRHVAFIKIDVQAYEKCALRGLLRTITRSKPKIFLEFSPYWMSKAGYDYREVYNFLSSLGYKFDHFIKLNLGTDGLPDYNSEFLGEWDVLAYPVLEPSLRGST